VSAPLLVLVEHDGREPDRLSLEALAFAQGLAVSLETTTEAVLVGAEPAAIAGRLGELATVSHVVADPRLADYAPAAFASAVLAVVERRSPMAVLGPGSDHGAARMGQPLVTNVVSVTPDSPWQLVRHRWAGSVLEDATLEASVRFMTIAPHVVPPTEGVAGSAPDLIVHDVELSEGDFLVRVGGREPREADGISLTDAKVVVGGGRGVGSAEDFALLEELAGLIGAAVGGSRVVTSLGWRPHRDQIGQTGVRIAPELYIACGISGAIQHMVGCRAARRILAINTDPDAPIMQLADFVVIGDLHTVLPAVMAEVRRTRTA
jgi:electron transfer flavoprotein alpha subunit